MDKIPSTPRYWLTVIAPRAIRNAIPISDFKGRLIDIVVSFAIAALFVLVYGRIVDPSLQLGFNPDTLIFWLAATFVGRLIASLIFLPAKIYEDQGGFIENPFEITCDPNDKNLDLSVQKYVWLTVKNKSRVSNITDCRLVLSKIIDLENNQPINCPTLYLTWSGREKDYQQEVNTPATIYFNSERWCDVAHTIKGQQRATYTTTFAYFSEHTSIKPGNYRLTINAIGMWKDHPISHAYSVDLSFQPEDNLKLERIEEIKDSNTKLSAQTGN